MAKREENILEKERRLALRAAKELFYDQKCKDDINNATSVNAITRALISARKRKKS